MRSITPRLRAGLLRIRRAVWGQWAGSLGQTMWSLTSAATRKCGSKGEGNSQEAILCISPSPSAICMGQPQTVISEVGPSFRGTLFIQVTRTKQAEDPLRILPTALQVCPRAYQSLCLGTGGRNWAVHRYREGRPVNKCMCQGPKGTSVYSHPEAWLLCLYVSFLPVLSQSDPGLYWASSNSPVSPEKKDQGLDDHIVSWFDNCSWVPSA